MHLFEQWFNAKFMDGLSRSDVTLTPRVLLSGENTEDSDANGLRNGDSETQLEAGREDDVRVPPMPMATNIMLLVFLTCVSPNTSLPPKNNLNLVFRLLSSLPNMLWITSAGSQPKTHRSVLKSLHSFSFRLPAKRWVRLHSCSRFTNSPFPELF